PVPGSRQFHLFYRRFRRNADWRRERWPVTCADAGGRQDGAGGAAGKGSGGSTPAHPRSHEDGTCHHRTEGRDHRRDHCRRIPGGRWNGAGAAGGLTSTVPICHHSVHRHPRASFTQSTCELELGHVLGEFGTGASCKTRSTDCCNIEPLVSCDEVTLAVTALNVHHPQAEEYVSVSGIADAVIVDVADARRCHFFNPCSVLRA